MSATTTTTTVHRCDLCDEPYLPADLTVLRGRYPEVLSVDICRECQARPISDVLGKLRSMRGMGRHTHAGPCPG